MNTSREVPSLPLTDGRADPPVFVAATIIRHFPSDRLRQIEAAWAAPRRARAAALRSIGIDLESSHWNWTNKKARVERGELDLHAIECAGEVQGLMAISSTPRPAVLTTGLNVLYLDYIETAPWNLRAPGQIPQFLGVGSALIAEVITLSVERGLGGRIGLHALPQAERFYATCCEMTRLGVDPHYFDLTYFEYPEGVGPAWLAARRSNP